MGRVNFTLSIAAEYLRTSKAPRPFFTFVAQIKRIFTFTQERANRLVRYVEIMRAYKRGALVQDIVGKYGCSKSTVLRYARIADLPKRPRHFDPKIRAATIALYRQGKPIAEIQARLGVSQAYISKTATEEGINRRKFSKRPDQSFVSLPRPASSLHHQLGPNALE
jgi:hypothetical protein